jgi:hypothetical protein
VLSAGAPSARAGDEAAVVPARTLLYGTINDAWLAATIDHWADSGYSGFIIPSYVQWFSSASALEEHRAHLTDLARRGAKIGITENFIDIQLAATRYDDGRGLPAWQDETGWQAVLANFERIAEFARTTGMRGIALDTEHYGAHLWNARHARNAGLAKRTLERTVYDRGKRLMAAFQQAFPGGQMILLQEGAFWWAVQSDPEYELWPSFFNGMASSRPRPGIIVATESTYPENELLKLLNRDPETFIRQRAAQIQAAMSSIAEFPDYWKAEGSLAIGMWPLGVSYADKSSRYSSAVFSAQMDAARAVSGPYVWVYGHGSAWWRMTPREVVSHSEAPWHYTFDKPSQVAPMDPTAKDYFDVIRRTTRSRAAPAPSRRPRSDPGRCHTLALRRSPGAARCAAPRRRSAT